MARTAWPRALARRNIVARSASAAGAMCNVARIARNQWLYNKSLNVFATYNIILLTRAYIHKYNMSLSIYQIISTGRPANRASRELS